MLPIMHESPDLGNVNPEFLDLEDLQFSEEGLEKIKKSGSMLFMP
jgi:hypothetical protein